MIYVSKRQEKLLYYIRNKDVISFLELASLLHVSMKTIRNDIADINKQAETVMITSLKGKGYALHITNNVPINALSTEKSS